MAWITLAGFPEEEHRDMSTAEEQSIRWSVHPAREQPARAVAALVVVLIACSFVWLTVGGSEKLMLASIAAGVAAALLLASLSKFFLRSHFEMDSESISARYPFSSRCFKWRDLRRFVADRHGGYLSTRRRPSRWDQPPPRRPPSETCARGRD